MTLQHLISTMNMADSSFLEQMNCKVDILAVNQTDYTREENYQTKDIAIRILSTTERGLSKSRNMLLDNATSDIAIIGDDDLVYLENYDSIIRQAYTDYPDADIIAFSFTEKWGERTRQQFKKPRRMSIFNISKIASVEITFKKDRVNEMGLQFDTRLGLGAEFYIGEENAFLADALRAGLRIYYMPETICYHIPPTGARVKWQNNFDETYFTNKGASFYRIYGKLFLPFSFAFLILKKRKLFKDINLFSALRWMKNGRRKYKELS